MSDITCPSCRAIISDDGEKVIKRSPRIKQLEDLREKLEALEKKIEEQAKGGKRVKESDDDEW